MDALEFHTHIAYIMLQDEEYAEKIQDIVDSEKSNDERIYDIYNFLGNLRGTTN